MLMLHFDPPTTYYSGSTEGIWRRALVLSRYLTSRHPIKLFHSPNYHQHSSICSNIFIRCPNPTSLAFHSKLLHFLRRLRRNTKFSLQCTYARSNCSMSHLLTPRDSLYQLQLRFISSGNRQKFPTQTRIAYIRLCRKPWI
jgi:hypothetical protein